MPNIFLHAGAPKTGTSYLQVLFAKNSERLFASGVSYPEGYASDLARAGGITSGNGVHLANYIRPNLPHPIQNKDAFPREFERHLKDAKGKSVLYSSEFLAFPAGERVTTISKIASDNDYQVRVIYLVRDIAEAAFSGYSQAIKRHGETGSFKQFLTNYNPHYQSLLKSAVDAFGAEAMIVRNYEEHSDRLSALFFQDILGLDFSPEGERIINRSLSPKEAELLRLMNEGFPGSVKHSTFISDALMSINRKREPFTPTHEEAALLERRFRPTIDYVNGFIEGRPIAITQGSVDERSPATTNEFESAIVNIISKLVSVVVK